MKNKINLALRTMATSALLWATSQTILAQPYTNAVLADHPLAYWRLQETSGTVASDSAGSFNGVYTNALLGQAGYTNGANPAELAAAFGAPAGQTAGSCVGGISVDFASAGATNFSVEAWVNDNGYGEVSGAGIVGKGSGAGGEEFYLDCGGGSSAFRFFVRNAAGSAFNASGTVHPNGNWHHLVGVCDEVNGYIYLYVDGLSNAVSSVSGGIHASANPYLTIGARQSGSGTAYDYQFSGSLGEVATYPYALSSTQVLAHYYAAGVAPVITLTPTNTVTIDEGATLTLPAAAMGTPPLIYQWTTNGVAIGGQTNATLVLTNISASQYNGLQVNFTVTNAYGSASDSGTGGTYLSVNSGAPQIVSSVLPSQLTLYQGLSFAYSVNISGTEPFYYQWLSNSIPIPTATNASFTAVATLGTNTYSVTISNNYNGGSVTPSSSAMLVGIADPAKSYPNTVFQDHPVAYWRLDESSGATVANDYMGGHDGNYNNATLGLPGYSPLFDPDTAAGFGPDFGTAPTGSDVSEIDNSGNGIALIDFSQPLGSNAQFSVEAWVKGAPTQPSSGSCIIAKGNSGSDEFVLDASAPGTKFRFYIRRAGSLGTSAIYSPLGPDNNWHHLVGVCDEAGGAMYLYVDGVNNGTITAISTNGLYSSSVPLSIGAQSAGQFDGIIDEVAAYNYALSPIQVQNHFNAAPVPPHLTQLPPPLVVAYRGENVTNTAVAAGSSPLTNQWYTVVGAVTNVLAGQTNFSLVLTNVQTGTNTYVFRSSNAFGSTNTAGTVVQVPAASGPPQLVADIHPRPVALFAGQSLTYSVTAIGSAPLAYQWYTNGVAVGGATNPSFSIPSLSTNNAGSYYCGITNSIAPYSTNSSTTTLAIVSTPANPYPFTVMADHPVAYFRLDEAPGSLVGYDYVGGNIGNYSNVTFDVSGIFGTNWDADPAVWFGTNGVQNSLLGATITNVDFAVPNGQNGAFSVEAWAKGPSGVNQLSGGAIVGKGVGNGDEQFALDAHFGFRFYVRNQASGVSVAGAQGNAPVGGSLVGGNWQMDGNWHHVVGVCDQANSNILLYVDGSLIGPNIITNGVVPPLAYQYDIGHTGSTGTNGVIYTLAGIHEPADVGSAWWNANAVSIGSRNKNSGSPGYTLNLNGAVDDVALYNYALTPLQVTNHYVVARGFPVTLQVQLTNNQPQIVWPAAWVTAKLQSATNIIGPWVTVTNATTPYLAPGSAKQQFYRLKLF